MYEALCRPSGTTLDIVHAKGGPPITQRTWGLDVHAVPGLTPRWGSPEGVLPAKPHHVSDHVFAAVD